MAHETSPNTHPTEVAGPGVDLPHEQSAEHATMNVGQIDELGRHFNERLGRIEVMYATPEDSLSAMEAAGLSTDLLVEALTADPDSFGAISRFRGPIDSMAHTAGSMHTHQTGHPHPETHYPSTDPNYQKALEVLRAVKEKALDRNHDGTYQGSRQADARTANGRKSIVMDAVQGLKLMAEVNRDGRVLVSPQTAERLKEFLRGKGTNLRQYTPRQAR